jgi:hypothetical protein
MKNIDQEDLLKANIFSNCLGIYKNCLAFSPPIIVIITYTVSTIITSHL